MNNVPNQNVKVQQETLADSNSDAVRFHIECIECIETPHCLKITLPLFKFLQKIFPIPLSFCHMQWRVLQMTL